MKATLEFNLPEEQVEFLLASNAGKLAWEVSLIQSELRRWQKHGHDFKTVDEALDAVRTTLLDAFQLIDDQ